MSGNSLSVGPAQQTTKNDLNYSGRPQERNAFFSLSARRIAFCYVLPCHNAMDHDIAQIPKKDFQLCYVMGLHNDSVSK